MYEILKQIYDLPWYKVIAIAIADDFIVLMKIWPFFIFLIIVVAVLLFLTNRPSDKEKINK